MDGTHPRGFLEETRTALVEAAFELIGREGFAATTAAAIGEEAGFTERTFFRYFPAKEDVVFSPMEARFEDHVPHIRQRVAVGGLTVDSLIDAILDAYDHDPSRRAVVLRGMALAMENPELERRLAYHLQWASDRIARTVADILGQDRPDLSVRVTVAVAVAVMATAVSQWLESGRRTPIRDVIADARRAAEGGLSGTRLPPPR